MGTSRQARYDEIAEFYTSATGDSVDDPATAALLDLVGPVAGLRLLDLACGHGRIARALARRGAQVVGIDLSGALLERARTAEVSEPLGITYIEGDVMSPSVLAGERFDTVVCNYGLSDIDDLDEVLVTISRVLDLGGFVVFSILHPCFPGWGADAPSSWPPGLGYYREGWWLADNPGFRGKVGANHRMLSTYLNALTRCGFAVETVVEPPASWDTWGNPPPDTDPVPVFLVVGCRRR